MLSFGEGPSLTVRLVQHWEISMPDDLFEKAKATFTNMPQYEILRSIMPQPQSLIRTYPLFKLNEASFTFLLTPAFERHADCSPDKLEYSHNGIPYPKLEHFAQSLLDTQNYADLEDLVDGMDLDEAWGEANLDFEHIPIDYIKRKNELICESLPGLPGLMASLSTTPDPKGAWTRAVRGKRARMMPKYSEELYATRFRLIGSPDPRMDKSRQV